MAPDAGRRGGAELTDEQLGAFGIGPDDEGFHAVDPTDPSWNESWFWDWYDAAGTRAGHCRIGSFPGQGRLWIWLYLLRPGTGGAPEWLCLDQPRLDLTDLQTPRLSYDRWGLAVDWRPHPPLRAGRLRVAGRARTISGPRAGRMVDVEVTVEVTAAGVPHSTGPGDVEGHESDRFDARRFEQPITAAVTVTADGVVDAYPARGERDHSWGPRAWNIEWTFFALSRTDERLQFVEVRIEGLGAPIAVGSRQASTGVQEVIAVQVRSAGDDPLGPGPAQVEVVAADGAVVAGRVEVITTHELDLSHCLQPPRPSRYRRALVRLHPVSGDEPFLGWLEDHRLGPAEPAQP